MNIEGKELEVKFYLSNRNEMERKLNKLGKITAPRVLEVNLRFDTPSRTLTSAGKVLRLRRDSRSRITYKASGTVSGGASLRQELEFTVSDFESAKAVFEALGYEVYTIYEKYRTTYQLDDLEVDLDELPTGDLVEIEGAEPERIQELAEKLELRWEKRILDSYTVLFERTRQALAMNVRDWTFENFKGITVQPEAIGISPADR